MRKVFVIILTLIFALSLAVPAAASESAPAGDVVILYTNDVHTYIDGPLSYDVIAALKTTLIAQYGYGNVILVDAGDHVQGTAYGSMDKGMTIVQLMNEAGYDTATLGNHEFDYGMEGTMAIIDAAEYSYISCNFYHEENGVRGEKVLSPRHFFGTPSGLEVAIVGITTPESFTKSTPAYFQDGSGNYIYGISGGEDGAALYADVQAAIDGIGGVDAVIALGHLGDDPASLPWTSEEVIANVTGLDAFIDGHSHSTVECKEVADKDGNAVLLTQTGEYFDRIGMMVIDGETGEITTDFIEFEEILETVVDEAGNPVLDEDGEEQTQVVGYKFISDLFTGAEWCSDESVAAIKNDWMTKIDEELGTVIGSTALTFDNYTADGNRLVRSQETNTGDFAADALYFLFDNLDMDVDVAIMNGGGVRNKALTGEISYQTCKSIHTFGNVACLQTITGQQLLDALEWGARSAGTGEECGGFLQVSGITYKIDGEWPASLQQDDKGVWIGGPTGGYRVHDVKIYNKDSNTWDDLDLTATYNLAGYNYTLRDLGDGFNMFDGAVNVLDYVMEDYMVLANYVQAFEGGVVEASNSPLNAKYPGFHVDYGTTNGSERIVFEAAVRENASAEIETALAETLTPTQAVVTVPAEEASSNGTVWILAALSFAVLGALAISFRKKEH